MSAVKGSINVTRRLEIGGPVTSSSSTSATPREIHFIAEVKCKGNNCTNKKRVEWKDRHDTKCDRCQLPMEYTGRVDQSM